MQLAVIDRLNGVAQAAMPDGANKTQREAAKTPGQGFGELLLAQAQKAAGPQAPAAANVGEEPAGGVNFSKHALSRVEERGIELTPDLMDKLAGSVERAQEKGAVNILAFGAEQAFIINVPHNRVITTISQAEMKEKIFTNIDAAILL